LGEKPKRDPQYKGIFVGADLSQQNLESFALYKKKKISDPGVIA
jgi:hypothetical protein